VGAFVKAKSTLPAWARETPKLEIAYFTRGTTEPLVRILSKDADAIFL
jgi:hypothetical protein